ncbi:u3 small nucleolar rna-associated protein hypothetical protein [Limosa lapponica baueri]|uniref:U3 small nucleolar rna-associated protein 18 homolog n=1 Tax=Limosa lapponica baueri TaxID=1758121 RepID=A0A2I0TQ92_LIMLA|nr:u3 small nucleolar rna-associated protein hypothetical protein [Limosa lapponica baueri]
MMKLRKSKFSVDMTHKYRKDFMKSDAEKILTKKKLKRRLEEQTGNFISNSESLPKGILKMSTCLPANQERFAEGKLVTVQFHPSAQVVMTAGHDRSVSLFQVDGIKNPRIQSIYLESFPIYKARFSVDGEQVIATGTHHKMFFVYDMMSGSIIPIQKVREEGEVFIWDVRSRKCLHKFEDEGSLEGKCIAVSKNNQYVACGSASGVVNLYTTDVCLKENHPKPAKAIMNLVTSATCVTFNPTTEILAVASCEADEAVKLAETLFRFLKEDTGENGPVTEVKVALELLTLS